MKKFIALLMIFATLMTAAAFAKGAYLGTMTVVNCKNWVTLRESASTSADTVIRGILDVPENFSVLCAIGFGHKADERKPQNEDKLKWENVSWQ